MRVFLVSLSTCTRAPCSLGPTRSHRDAMYSSNNSENEPVPSNTRAPALEEISRDDREWARMRTSAIGGSLKKRTLTFVAVLLLSGSAHAIPWKSAVSFFEKLFEGAADAKVATTAGKAGEEAAVAGKAAEGTSARAAAMQADHVPVSDSYVGTTQVLSAAAEPKPNITSEPLGKSRSDIAAYKKFRESAVKGDSVAMLRMAEMTSSGKVSDPGVPYRAYWLFQAVRLGNQAASQRLRTQCSSENGQRQSDQWFDSACSTTDGKKHYLGAGSANAYEHPVPVVPIKR